MPTAVEMFLKIDGITGESTVRGHEGEIQLDSFSLGLTNVGSSGTAGGGEGAGKTVFQDFHFTSKIGKHTPQIFGGAAQGKLFQKAFLTLDSVLNKGVLVPDLKISFTDLLFTEYKVMDIASLKLEDAVSAEGGLITSGPVDSASFSFRSVEVSSGGQTTSAGMISDAVDIIKKKTAS